MPVPGGSRRAVREALPRWWLAGDGGLGKGTGGSARATAPVPPVPLGRGEWAGCRGERAQCGQLRWRVSVAAAPPLHIGAGGLPRGLTAFLQLFILVWPSSSFLPQLGFAGHGVLSLPISGSGFDSEATLMV